MRKGGYNLRKISKRILKYAGVFILATIMVLSTVSVSGFNVFLDPPIPPTPTGPTEGDPGTSYTYCTSNTGMTDAYFFFDWDDGTNSGWIGP